MTTTEITVKGAREHNLRNVNLSLPRGKLICFTGVSGSGKSSLAFDTLYAEGQRRYVESLSNFARQFMGQMPKPDVDLIAGLSPSISISQKSTGTNPRSTVGTITEIYDFLRVLYARVGTGHCPDCGVPIEAQTREQMIGRILELETERLVILAPLVRRQKGEFRDLFEDLRKQGFARARVDGTIVQLSEPPALDRARRHDVEVVIDRLTRDASQRGRLAEAVDAALKLGDGTLIVVCDDGTDGNRPATARLANASGEVLFSSDFACGQCGQSFPTPTPQLFSFNSPHGMCPGCDGLGRLYTFVPELLVTEPGLSVKRGAIGLVGKWSSLSRYKRHIYSGVAESIERYRDLEPGTMLETPWRDLPSELRNAWLWGTGSLHITFTWGGGSRKHKYGGQFAGLIAELVDRYRSTRNKMYLRAMEKYMDTLDCPDCRGQRLNRQARAVTLRSEAPGFADTPARSLPELCELPADRLSEFFSQIELEPPAQRIAGEVLKEIRTRIGFLLGVGLDYLSLSRTAPTLSGGESQRIRLAGQIGSGLAGVLYILDEPSIGLHARDNDRLIDTLLQLRDRGNTLIVVEHDEDTMRAADMVVDFGPGPGVKGGKVVARGSVEDLIKSRQSVTGKYLGGKARIEVPEQPRAGSGATLTVRGASHHNLKEIDVSIPLGTLTCVTGVSGSGKSSLIGDIVEPALRRALNGAECEAGRHESIEGLEHLDKTIAIDQAPIGRTPRSNPATYVKVFDEIRNLYAQLPEAKTRGYTAGRFSFNVSGGRCGACDGNGANKLEMDFLADVWVTCPVCQGHRYNRETLAVRFKEKSIADVLEMDVSQALELFQNIPKIASRLQTLVDVGLEYLQLGQPSPTLSGGEAQRIKLSRELSKKSTGRTLYVLDEPTTGLHFADIKLLLRVLHDLVDRGNTVVVVEHNLDVIKTADWVIDLGPEGGEGGGRLVVEGPPRAVADCEASHTGRALRRVLDKRPAARRSAPRPMAASSGDTANGTIESTTRSSSANGSGPQLVVEGASQHNLKAVNVSLPRDAMTVFCGPSGSGKSSLAMDTIYAEGQRRYVESLSSYARQFIGQMQKPQAERIEGLSPAIALEQKNLGHSPRSTVGTVTEIYDYFRILMARLGTMYCPACDRPVGTQTVDQIVDKVLQLEEGTRFLLLAPLTRPASQDAGELWERLRGDGYSRVRIDGITFPLEEAPELDPRLEHALQLVIDRLTLRKDDRQRIAESVELALNVGHGVLQLALADQEREEPDWDEINHSQHLACGDCGRSFQPLTPHHFSFNAAAGWCPECEGLGVQTGTNPAALLRGERLSLAEGAVALWPDLNISLSRQLAIALCRQLGISPTTPLRELTLRQRRQLFHGTGETWIEVRSADGEKAAEVFGEPSADTPIAAVPWRFQYKGIYPALEEASRLSPAARYRLQQFTAEIECTACDGARLHDAAAAVRFAGLTIGDYVRMPLDRLAEQVRGWKLDARQRRIAGEVVREIRTRIQFLNDVGLSYLTLGRSAATLSGGEAQRIRLAAQLGSGLCGVLYVLDEPTIGLHPRDNRRLLKALHRLRDLGNTLLVVEHDHDVIAGSDYLCDFGPRAGRLGGEIVAQGPPRQLSPEERSVTGPYLDGSRAIAIPSNRRPAENPAVDQRLTIRGASEHNLQQVDVTIPLGVLSAITGPSGSGKSTLINDVLYPALARRLHRSMLRPGRHAAIEGVEHIDKVIRVDQSPLGNTPSSTPATYTGVFDLIRLLFAKLPEAKSRGYSARQFSFNVPGGRCEACEGSGQNCIEMHFLPDVWVRCEDCQGHRFTRETLEVRYHGYSIADVLEMSCGEALRLFDAQPKIARILQTLVDVGLDYVTLGQSAPTLSGGEAQRVKLAAELARPQTGQTLYLLDEPTTGLHFDDIAKLLDVLQRLVDLGNTVVLIEHNLDVLKTVDWIIDMGPEAGERGGHVVCSGSPEQVVAYAAAARKAKANRKASPPLRSHTGEFLAAVLKRGPYAVRRATDPETYLTEQLEAQQASLGVPTPTRAAWERDGRAWHLRAPRDRAGQAVLWDAECLRELIALLEQDGRFAKFHFKHESRIEITGGQHPRAQVHGVFARSQWFLHAFSRESHWLKLKFRVPPRTFKKRELLESLRLPTLDELEIEGIYSHQPRVRVTTKKGFQEIEIRLFRVAEVRSEAFRAFLQRACDAYAPPLQPAELRPNERGETTTEAAVAGPVAAGGLTQPWQALGRKWHSLAKGFPENQPPEWPLQLADKLLGSLEKIVGEQSLRYAREDAIEIQPPQTDQVLGQLETKHRDSLRLVLRGDAADWDERLLERIPFADVDATPTDTTGDGDNRLAEREPTEQSTDGETPPPVAIFRITEPQHLRSRNFTKFMKQFFATATSRGESG
jgi:excinuclease ABC subunit A